MLHDIFLPAAIGIFVLILAKGTNALVPIILPPVFIVKEYWAVVREGKPLAVNPKYTVILLKTSKLLVVAASFPTGADLYILIGQPHPVVDNALEISEFNPQNNITAKS